jgi:hypothetical protein
MIQGVYNGWGGDFRTVNWAARVSRINIVAGSAAAGTGILNIGKDAGGPTVSGLMNSIIAYLPLEHSVRLAVQCDTPKATVVLG